MGSLLSLWLPEAKGRQKVFLRLDLKKQRMLHKHDFLKALQSIGISIGCGVLFKKVWTLLDCESKQALSYKQFQTIISPEAHIREFTKMIPLLVDVPDDEFKAYKKAKITTKRQYIYSMSQNCCR
eukprot:UN10904